MELSQQQKDAVEYYGSPALVVAGAGSGKTRTLTAKIEHLISKGFDPERILSITFTNKAAEEMKTRLVKATGLPLDKFPWVRTYHSACFKILKEHCSLMGFTAPLQVYSTYHQEKTIKEILATNNFDKKHTKNVMSHISKAKNSGNVDDYFSDHPRVFNIRLYDIYEIYEKELYEKNCVDFDNILFITRDLFRQFPDIKKKYQDLFQFILVDEYQDSNNLQEELTVQLISGNNLFCVGDDWQSVYGFRGSNINHFLSFPRKYKDAKIFYLEQNYRSANEIVHVANELINNNKKKMDKRCFSDKSGGLVELYHLYNEPEEARWVADKINVLRKTGVHYENMAIMYRTKSLSLHFEKTLRAFGIPYKMMGSKGFFERKEILDLNCYLATAVFPKDDVSFERVINTPKRGIGPGMLKKIRGLRTGDMSLQDCARKMITERILTPKVHKALTGLIETIDYIKHLKPGDALNEVMERTDYEQFLKDASKADKMGFTSRMENIEVLIYTASQNNSIEEYLEEAALIRDDKDDEEENKNSAVALSTIHASKGLEYHTVFVVGCEEEIFPHWRSAESDSGLQEERRLMYVAVTRAEKYLYMTSASSRRGKRVRRSRFLNEIQRSLL